MAARLCFGFCLIVALTNIACNEASRLRRIEDRLDGLQDRIGGLDDRFGELKDRLDRESRFRREDTRTLFEKIDSIATMLNMSAELAQNREQTETSNISDNWQGDIKCKLIRKDMMDIMKNIDKSISDVQCRERSKTSDTSTDWRRGLLLLTNAFRDEKVLNTEVRDQFPNFTDQVQKGMRMVLNEINTNQVQLQNLVREMNEITMALKDEKQWNTELRDQFPHFKDQVQKGMGTILREVNTNQVQTKKTIEEISDLTMAFKDKNQPITEIKDQLQGVNDEIHDVATDIRSVLNGTDTNQIKLNNIIHEMAELKTALGVYEIIFWNDVRTGSCEELNERGSRVSGQYNVYPDSRTDPVRVYCDQETDGGGWTVFQRREDGSEDFFRGWEDYKDGFGNLDHEFWLGNELLSILTSGKGHQLRIELENFDGERRFAKYDEFQIQPEDEKYTLKVSGYTGTAGDSLKYHNGSPFSTKDRDNDESNGNCAVKYTGAWWYKGCFYSNLNGQYIGRKDDATGIVWTQEWGVYNSLKFTEMKFK